jgi:hypothetical protein
VESGSDRGTGTEIGVARVNDVEAATETGTEMGTNIEARPRTGASVTVAADGSESAGAKTSSGSPSRIARTRAAGAIGKKIKRMTYAAPLGAPESDGEHLDALCSIIHQQRYVSLVLAVAIVLGLIEVAII